MIIPVELDQRNVVNHNLYFIRQRLLTMTQEEFGDWLSITRNMVNSYERDIVIPSIDLLIKLDDKLQMDINKLLKEKMTFQNFREFFRDPEVSISKIEQLINQQTE